MSDLEMINSLTGDETGVLRRAGKTPIRWTPKRVIEDTVRALSGQFTGPQGPKGDTGATGATGARGPAGAPKRVERYTGIVAGTSGIATVTFPAFASVPLGKVIDGWNGDQQITGMVTAATTTTATVAVKRSRGALLLSAGPYETAPAGSVVMIELIGD